MRQQWIELRFNNRLWGRYNPHRRIIEISRQDVRAIFDLNVLDKRLEVVEEKETTCRQNSKLVLD